MPLQLFKKQQRMPPIERVKELSSHGFSEPEIIDILRKEGYTPQEIDLALTQVLKEKLQSPSMTSQPKQAEDNKMPTFDDVIKKVQTEQAPIQSANIQPQQMAYPQQYSWEDYLNYIDYMIHSRISEVSKELEKINIKYQNLERRIEEINQNVKQTVLSKEDAYSQIIKEIEGVSTKIAELMQRISALEEIFKEILPALIESVRSLTKLVQEK